MVATWQSYIAWTQSNPAWEVFGIYVCVYVCIYLPTLWYFGPPSTGHHLQVRLGIGHDWLTLMNEPKFVTDNMDVEPKPLTYNRYVCGGVISRVGTRETNIPWDELILLFIPPFPGEVSNHVAIATWIVAFFTLGCVCGGGWWVQGANTRPSMYWHKLNYIWILSSFHFKLKWGWPPLKTTTNMNWFLWFMLTTRVMYMVIWP